MSAPLKKVVKVSPAICSSRHQYAYLVLECGHKVRAPLNQMTSYPKRKRCEDCEAIAKVQP